MPNTPKKSALDIFKDRNDATNTTNDVITSQPHNVISYKKVYKNVPWYPPSDRLKKELKKLALDEETSMSALLTEGIKLLFEKRGKEIDEYM